MALDLNQTPDSPLSNQFDPQSQPSFGGIDTAVQFASVPNPFESMDPYVVNAIQNGAQGIGQFAPGREGPMGGIETRASGTPFASNPFESSGFGGGSIQWGGTSNPQEVDYAPSANTFSVRQQSINSATQTLNQMNGLTGMAAATFHQTGNVSRPFTSGQTNILPPYTPTSPQAQFDNFMNGSNSESEGNTEVMQNLFNGPYGRTASNMLGMTFERPSNGVASPGQPFSSYPYDFNQNTDLANRFSNGQIDTNQFFAGVASLNVQRDSGLLGGVFETGTNPFETGDLNTNVFGNLFRLQGSTINFGKGFGGSF